jgi:hypothetical protein
MVLCSFRLLAIDLPPPGGGGDTNSGVMLDSWSFADTNYWTSDLGFYPISCSNICVSSLGPGNSLDVDSTNASWLEFNVCEATGSTNLNVVSDGSAMFWFAPNWASTSDTNEVGTGPGVFGRFLEIGEFTTNASYGWWSLYTDNGGNNLYFTAQDENGDQLNYLSAPVTFTSNSWHLIVLSWTSTNTSLYVDGMCMTNGPGISVLPSTDVIARGFTIGSDAATGVSQMHGAINSLKTYNYALDANTISAEWVLDGIFYLHNPDTMANFANPPYSPGISDIFDVVSGPGYLQVVGTNTTTCTNSANVWITNVMAMPGTNGSINMGFMVAGGNSTLPYDVFATTVLPMPLTNGVWSWLGQAYPCETNVIYGLTNRAVYLILGTPQDSDGDGLTDAFELLITHTNPYSPDSAGDGIADGWKLLAGMPLNSQAPIPTLNSGNCPSCPVP